MIKNVLIFSLILTITFFYNAQLATSATFYGLKNAFGGYEDINMKVYERINPAIVYIDADVPNGISSGTGCVIDESGVILTSSHVIDGAKNIIVETSNGEEYKATVLFSKGVEKDLALLKITPKNSLPCVKLGDSSNVKVGQQILAIGNPFGFSGTLTTGIVSRIDYKRNKIQTDAAINPGSSGGPLLNANGEVIGISQSIYNPDNNKSNIGIGFAIPSNTAKDFIKLAKAEKKFWVDLLDI